MNRSCNRYCSTDQQIFVESIVDSIVDRFNLAFFFHGQLIVDDDENLNQILRLLNCICDTTFIKPIIDLERFVHLITYAS